MQFLNGYAPFLVFLIIVDGKYTYNYYYFNISYLKSIIKIFLLQKFTRSNCLSAS